MAANRNAANRMERGERDPLLRRQSDGEEGVSIHDVMERTSFLHFGFGETRGTSDAFAATVVGFMLIGMALMCLLCWKLTLTEYNAVGVILQDFGVYNSSSPALFAPPVPGNATAAVGDLADVHSLMWLTVSHELLHVAWWFFRAACYATGVCAALGLICFMWPNVCMIFATTAPLVLLGIGGWFWTVAFAAGLYADWHLFASFWFGAIVLCCCCCRGFCTSDFPRRSEDGAPPVRWP